MQTAADPDLPPAVRAFDSLALDFDERFGGWASVAAQRRAVRRELLAAFPEGALLLELGGGTGEDALFLAERGRRILLTDGSKRMVAEAGRKARAANLEGPIETRCVRLEELSSFADAWEAEGREPFAGCYSNFAALNCLVGGTALGDFGRALARFLAPGARAQLVVFGPFSPGEVLVLLSRGKRAAAFRRLSAHPVPARVNGHSFEVEYPSPRDHAQALAPWFRLERTRGIGVFVPPSSAEPEISRFPRLLSTLEALDRALAAPLALLGDHVLLDFVRTARALPR
jgi:SAM-dependent methyltransferase